MTPRLRNSSPSLSTGSPIEIDPVGGKAYQLLGTDPNGLFNNVATLSGYPFY